MTGKLNKPGPRAAAPSLLKRPVVLAGITILVIGAAATGAWVTQPPETAAPRPAKAAKVEPAAAEAPSLPAVSAAPVAVVLEGAPPPPELSSAEIARNAAPPPAPIPTAEPLEPADWVALPIDELRARANTDEIIAMEELARRLIQGVGVPKDQQAGAGWLLRAAQRGSAQSAFNVAVMYERGFVVERDSTRAVEWYRKAVAANLPTAKHNLALLLRDGKGAPRDGKETIELLRSAARQGMAASMFTLGDIYERGDAAPQDTPTAMAWFAITAEFERQTNPGTETALAKTASQRMETLKRILTPAELERAQQVGQSEFKLIVEALSPPKPPAEPAAPAPAETVEVHPPAAEPRDWPKAANDQIRVIQQALFDLKFLRDKPDGAIGPVTRAAIRTFQRSIAVRETGEPTVEVYAALKELLTSRDVVANSPLPLPAKTEPAPAATPTAEVPPVDLPRVDIPKTSPGKVEAAATEGATVTPTVVPPKVESAVVDLGQPEPPPPPPTSADFAGVTPAQPAAVWPATPADQVKAIQVLLREFEFLNDAADGLVGPNTRTAISAYQRAAGLAVTGEPSKAVFDALKERRGLKAPTPN